MKSTSKADKCLDKQGKSFMKTKAFYFKIMATFVSLILITLLWLVPFDQASKGAIDSSLKEAAIVFGVAKGLNAVVSVVQGTQVNAPFVAISVGEVLDPLNDLIEQFSWVMLASITSLGIQKIFSNMISSNAYMIVLTLGLCILNMWLYFRFKYDGKVRSYCTRFVVILIFLRISLPLMLMANVYVYQHYVQQDYNIEKTQMAVAQASQQIKTIDGSTNTSKQNFLDSITEKFDLAFYKRKLAQYEAIASNASDNILNLTIAFIFKTILFPLIFLFLFYKVTISLTRFSEDSR